MTTFRQKIPVVVKFISKHPDKISRMGNDYVVADFGTSNVTVSGTSTATLSSTTISPNYPINVALFSAAGTMVDRVTITPTEQEFRPLFSLLTDHRASESEQKSTLEELEAVVKEG